MKFLRDISEASAKVKLVVWATLSLALLALLFPLPEYYRWDSGKHEFWIEDKFYSHTIYAPHWVKEDPDSRERKEREFLLEYDFYGEKRPNFVRMAGESIIVFLVGIGLAFAIRSPQNGERQSR